MINILFDIDGTLVESYEFDGELYVQSVTEVIGDVHIHEDWNAYTHVTDSGILMQILEENGIAANDEHFSSVKSRFIHLIRNHLINTPCVAKPGAVQCLDLISKSLEYSCGFATGGWGQTAEMKLKSAGINLTEYPLYSSDHHHERIEIMQLCYNHLSGRGDAVYVGDGQWDMVASEKLNWGFVGIGERLRDIADIWISDFNDPNWQDAPNKALQRTLRQAQCR